MRFFSPSWWWLPLAQIWRKRSEGRWRGVLKNLRWGEATQLAKCCIIWKMGSVGSGTIGLLHQICSNLRNSMQILFVIYFFCFSLALGKALHKSINFFTVSLVSLYKFLNTLPRYSLFLRNLSHHFSLSMFTGKVFSLLLMSCFCVLSNFGSVFVT